MLNEESAKKRANVVLEKCKMLRERVFSNLILGPAGYSVVELCLHDWKSINLSFLLSPSPPMKKKKIAFSLKKKYPVPFLAMLLYPLHFHTRLDRERLGETNVYLMNAGKGERSRWNLSISTLQNSRNIRDSLFLVRKNFYFRALLDCLAT